jgi:hypothetical protein
MRPPVPRRGLARCPPQPRPRRWACGGGPATTALITPARRRQLSSHASDRRMSWSVTHGVRPVVTLAYSARHDHGGGCVVKPPPPPPNQLPGAAPLATPPHGGPLDPGRCRQARPWMGTTAPPDGGDFALHPAALIIGHVANLRGSARQELRGGEEKEEPRRGAGEAARTAVLLRWGGIAMCPPPPSSLRCGDSYGGGVGVTSEMMDDKQTTIKS